MFNKYPWNLVKAALRHGDGTIFTAENLMRKYANFG
jgi:hypothetical protein